MLVLLNVMCVFLPSYIFAKNFYEPVGVQTDQSAVTNSPVAIYGEYTGTQDDASAIQGITSNSSAGQGSGVYGVSYGSLGRGVYGRALSTVGENYGVFGSSKSTSGVGVQGHATAISGSTYGVRGSSSSNSGIGVSGQTTSSTGTTCGVSGISVSTSGIGVSGNAQAITGQTYGVQGMSSSTTGVGVLGKGAATTGANYGVVGESTSTSGIGVYGNVTATSGKTYGIYGLSSSKDGYGVYGKNKSSGGYAIMSDGPMCVNGPMVVSGDLLVSPGQAIPQLSNIALKDNTLEASSVLYDSLKKVRDGIINRDTEGEWNGTFDSNGYSWVKCTWYNSVDFNIIIIYPGASNMKNIYTTCEIEHADGSKNVILAGFLPYGGAAKKMTLKQEEGKCVKSLKITLIGEPKKDFRLSEIECYYDKSLKL